MQTAAAQSIADPSMLVDAETLAELRLLFGERSAMLIGKTRELLAERTKALAPAAAQGALEPLGRIAHEIAGMAGQIGLKPLAQSALALERTCHQGEQATAVAGATSLAALAAASLDALPAA